MFPSSIPAVDPMVQVVAGGPGRVYLVRGRKVVRSIRGVELADIRAVLAEVDGTRTVEELQRALADEFSPESVLGLLEALEGAVRPSVAPRQREGIAIVGEGELGDAVRRALGGGAAPERCAVLVCALETGPAARVLELNALAQRLGVPLLPVLSWSNEICLGPTVIPGKTGCYECACRTAFAGPGPGLWELLPSLQLAPAPGLRALALTEILSELDALAQGADYPSLLGRVLSLTASSGRTWLQAEPSSDCSLCRGLTLPAGPRPISMAPKVEGPVDLDEAKRRALGALQKLGVELQMRGCHLAAPHLEPLSGIPFVHVRQRARLSSQAPLVLRSEPFENIFGKGLTPGQAWCSGAYEWLERNLSRYHGDVEVVRAPYAEVRDQAIDMPFYVQGLLEPYDVPGRGAFDEREPLDWVWGHCLRRGRPILLPASAVFVWSSSSFRGRSVAMPIPGSSGVAAACSKGDALLRGMLEIFEHDAWFSSMRTGVPLPQIDLRSVTDPDSLALIEHFHAAGFDVVLRDLTNDLGIPVIQALLHSRRDFTAYLSPGIGSHFDPVIALRRALTEAFQFLASILFFTRPAHQGNSALSIFEMAGELAQQLRRISGTKSFSQIEAVREPAGVQTCIDRLQARLPRADICMYDFSRPEIPEVSVVRTFVSGILNQIQWPPICIPDRVLDYRRAVGQAEAPRLKLEELYLGRMLS